MSPECDESAAAQHDPEQDRFDWALIVRNTVLVVVLFIFLWLLFNVELPSADRLRDMIDSWGWAAWLVFIGIYALVAMTPIPVTVMAVTAGLLFGVIDGTVLSVIGVLLGCWGGYWLARGLGRQVTVKMLGTRARTVERHLDQAGLEAIVVLRLLPGFPYWPVNYGSGAFGVGQRDFLIGSALAVIPGQLSLVAVGALISNPNIFTGTTVAVSWAIVLVMTVLAYWRWKAARPKGE
ncbi:TVP38/TMEM64 family protein [Yaniella halotolerans]|uniref:TVP38/TMEM64 family protein n=1 Tax=Yaniella halotolerans TaxID=225453 RepID=UPI0003B56649|nr:TVP38/TMEM64 family protein [Yaniella halotolerans]